MEPTEWVARIRALPDLMKLADAAVESAGGDRYDVMRALRDEHLERKQTYVWATIYRSPSATCSTGDHEVPPRTLEVVNPGLPGTLRLMIAEKMLHEVEAHGRKLAPDQVRKLEAIFGT